jgi:hypothetical protein
MAGTDDGVMGSTIHLFSLLDGLGIVSVMVVYVQDRDTFTAFA